MPYLLLYNFSTKRCVLALSSPLLFTSSTMTSGTCVVLLPSQRNSCFASCSVYFLLCSFMEAHLFPRESGQFIAERSKDVSVQEEGVQKVAEMLYSLRNTDHLNATGWKKANPLAPAATSDQVSPEVVDAFSHHTGHFSCWGGRSWCYTVASGF